MATALETYRALIPAHSAIPDATVTVYLERAIKVQAVVSVGGAPGLVTGGGGAEEVGALTQQRDHQLQRSYGPVGGNRAIADADLDLNTTRYGLAYLRIRGSRAAIRPTAVRTTT